MMSDATPNIDQYDLDPFEKGFWARKAGILAGEKIALEQRIAELEAKWSDRQAIAARGVELRKADGGGDPLDDYRRCIAELVAAYKRQSEAEEAKVRYMMKQDALLDEVKNATMVIYVWGNKTWHKDRPDLTKAFHDSADLLQAIIDKREQT